MSTPPLSAGIRRTLGFALALVTAKTLMVAQHDAALPATLWTLPVLLHDHLLIVLLYGGIDLFAQLWGRRQGDEQEAAANRGMWLVFVMALAWVAMSVPMAAVLGAPAPLAEIRASGGASAVMWAGLDLKTGAGAGVTVGGGLLSATLLIRAPRMRVIRTAILIGAMIAIGGPMGRDHVELEGLERDPFAVVIQGLGRGVQGAEGP